MDDIVHHLPGILLVYAMIALGLLSPGPNVLAVIGTSMSVGRREGKALALGIAFGSFLWATATWLGITAMLAAYAPALTAIQIAGGAYLLWLAYKSFRSAMSTTHELVTRVEHAPSAGALFWRGLAVQMTNPKAALAWIAAMSLSLGSESPPIVGIAVIAGTTLISVVGHQVYAVAFSTHLVIAAYRRAKRWIDFSLGAFFAFAGGKLLLGRG